MSAPTPDGVDPGDDGEPDAPVAEAADPVNPDVAPGTPSGDEVYDAMVAESRSSAGDGEDAGGDSPG